MVLTSVSRSFNQITVSTRVLLYNHKCGKKLIGAAKYFIEGLSNGHVSPNSLLKRHIKILFVNLAPTLDLRYSYLETIKSLLHVNIYFKKKTDSVLNMFE